MKTIIVKKIDDFNIIKGIDIPVINPVETSKKVVVEIKKTSPYKAMESKKKEIAELSHGMYKDFAVAIKAKLKSKIDKAYAEMVKKQQLIREIQEELINDKAMLEIQRRKLMAEHAIFFNPKKGEKVISDSEATDIKTKIQAALGNGCVLDDELKEIKDKIGIQYYTKASGKWQFLTITRLGEDIPQDGILPEDLTEKNKQDMLSQGM